MFLFEKTSSERALGSSTGEGPKGATSVCDRALRILSGGGGVSARPEGTGSGEPGRGGEERRYKGLKKTGGQVCGARDRHGWATF